MKELTDIFGPPISTYSRAQAIADGILVDLSQTKEAREAGFVWPIAMTSAAYEATIAAGGTWDPIEGTDGETQLVLPGAQSHAGRVWDVLWMLKIAIKAQAGGRVIDFSVFIDVRGDGRKPRQRLRAIAGPGDTATPVITIMLPTED